MLEDVDANKQNPLQLGAVKGSAELCEVLLKHGANPNSRKNASGSTVLHSAAKIGNATLCDTLLRVRQMYFKNKHLYIS